MMQVGKNVGMVTLNDALMDLVTKKIVAPEEAYVKSIDKAGFETMLKRVGLSGTGVPAPPAPAAPARLGAERPPIEVRLHGAKARAIFVEVLLEQDYPI